MDYKYEVERYKERFGFINLGEDRKFKLSAIGNLLESFSQQIAQTARDEAFEEVAIFLKQIGIEKEIVDEVRSLKSKPKGEV